ncbi:MAG TPA: GFA family protein [Caulobacteraceae bacterium]|nr:GFA family protein [Caulobacteraceae bacterium]
MIEAVCHCGAVSIAVPRAPEQVTDCNCSICRRLGALWAYYRATEVTITGVDATVAYVRHDGPNMGYLAQHHCRTCGCTTHWSSLDASVDRMGVNARMMAPEVLAQAAVRHFNGADDASFGD